MSTVTMSFVDDVRAALAAATSFDPEPDADAPRRLAVELSCMAGELLRRGKEFTQEQLLGALYKATVLIASGLHEHGHTPEVGESNFIETVADLLDT